jgi:hypothetical protein
MAEPPACRLAGFDITKTEEKVGSEPSFRNGDGFIFRAATAVGLPPPNTREK